MTKMSDPNLGRKLADRYELVELVGQGAMGKVYRAEDTLLGNLIVAVKFLSQTLLSSKMRERFEQEALTCAQLGQKSIHVVRVSDYGLNENGVPYYVMEFLEGESLSALIHPEPLSIPRFLDLSRQICLGLQSAHEGILPKGHERPISIIHRDIKPSNILVIQDPALGELAKILDFGIAKWMQADAEQTSSFMGTLAYASPEQMEGKELDNRSDIYSLGIMMFQMLTGRLPLHVSSHNFGGWYKAHHHQPPLSFRQANPRVTVPSGLENLVMRCLEKDPERRTASVQLLLNDLERIKKRLEDSFRVRERLRDKLPPTPLRTPSPKPLPDPNPPSYHDTICRLQSWPTKEKPIAEIAFPQLIPTSKGVIPTLWVMLKPVELQRRLIGNRYNNFVCTMSPHPMVMWLTVLYSASHGPRWLPIYLDLKVKENRAVAITLAQAGNYRVLFFSTEKPHQCAHVETCNIAPAQQKKLQEWVLAARRHPSVGSANTSKSMLKNELETKMKGQILDKLESLYVKTS